MKKELLQQLDAFLDSRDFYELMQAYRHTPMDAAKEFEAVKSALREAIAQPEQPATLQDFMNTRQEKESVQRTTMQARFAGRSSAATADFDLPAPNDIAQTAQPAAPVAPVTGLLIARQPTILIQSLVASKGWTQGFAAAFVDDFADSLRTAVPVAQAEPTEPAAWRTRYRSEPGMIGHYPWTYTERGRAVERLNPAYEFEPLYTQPKDADSRDAGQPENIRLGAPYNDPRFEAICREHSIWGTAQAALCAVFWRAAIQAKDATL